MNDLINREDAIKLFLERKNELAGIQGDLGGAMSGAVKLIERLPSADRRDGRMTKEKIESIRERMCEECCVFSTLSQLVKDEVCNTCPLNELEVEE